jgi:stearoyl-CoA desaturase (delta-9 desaturase)
MTFFSHGLLSLQWWQILLTTSLLTHVTIVSVTVYLHRCQAHRALELHPVASHFFHFWLWMTTGMHTGTWTSVHRKHHAKCETDEDPHSPRVRGIWTVLLGGAELYRAEAKNEETLRKFGHGTPDDWMERNIYSKYQNLGISLLMVIDVALFGIVGVSVWAVQMIWIPFWDGRCGQRGWTFSGLPQLLFARCEYECRAAWHPDRRRGISQQPSHLCNIGQILE